MNLCDFNDNTVDSSEIRQTHQLRLVVEIPLFYMVFVYIPGGDRRISDHQEYLSESHISSGVSLKENPHLLRPVISFSLPER